MWYNVFAMENAISILSSFVNVLNIHVKKSLLAITILSCLLCMCLLCQGCWTLKSFSSQTLLIENESQKNEFWDIVIRTEASAEDSSVSLLLDLKGDSRWFCVYDKTWGKRSDWYGCWVCWMKLDDGQLTFPTLWRGGAQFRDIPFGGQLFVHLSVPGHESASNQSWITIQEDVKFRACRCEEDWRPLSGVSVTFFNYTWNAEGTGYTKLRVGMAPHASVCLKSHSRAVVHLSKELADLGNEKALWKRPSEQKTNIIPLANCWEE